jgi:hypothetical protein
VHQASFLDFCLSYLGPELLNIVYREIALDDSGVVLVATTDDGVVGFVAGVTGVKSLYRKLARRRFALLLCLARGLDRKPGLL